MFTGIIETVGMIDKIAYKSDYKILSITPKIKFDNIELGESIAIDGICLTVVEYDDKSFKVESSRETIEKTTLRNYKVNTVVNLERALRMGDRFGGHMVSGHIDDTGSVSTVKPTGESILIGIDFNKKYDKLVIEKGSIAVDGISLTINKVNSGYFEVNIIPHTADNTTVGQYRIGRKVNLEFDLVGKYINKITDKSDNTSLTKKKLLESGW